MGCNHEWEFLQTLWEVDKLPSSGTYMNSREYAYFTCHNCGRVEKRIVRDTTQVEKSKVEEGA